MVSRILLWICAAIIAYTLWTFVYRLLWYRRYMGWIGIILIVAMTLAIDTHTASKRPSISDVLPATALPATPQCPKQCVNGCTFILGNSGTDLKEDLAQIHGSHDCVVYQNNQVIRSRNGLNQQP